MKRKFRIRVSLLAAGLLLLLVAAYFSAKPAYRWLKEWRAAVNLEKSSEALANEDWGLAKQLALASLRLRGDDGALEALRHLQQAAEGMERPKDPRFAQALFFHPEATALDRAESLPMIRKHAAAVFFLRAVESLDPQEAQSPPILLEKAQYLKDRGRWGEAKDVLLDQQLTLSQEPRLRLRLAEILLTEGGAGEVREAQGWISALLAEQGEVAMKAFRLLGQIPIPLLDLEVLPDLEAWIAERQEATTLDRLIARHQQLRQQAVRPETLLAEAIAEFREESPKDLATWLGTFGEHSEILELISEEDASQSLELFDLRNQSLAALGQLEALEAAMQEPPSGISVVKLRSLEAVLKGTMSNQAAETAAWEQALREASLDGSENHYLEIAARARTVGNSRVYSEALMGALRLGIGKIPLSNDLQPLFTILAQEGRSLELMRANRQLLRYEPTNLQLLNNYFYLSALHRDLELENCKEALQELVDLKPEILNFRSSLAIILLMLGESSEALSLFDEVNVDWTSLPPSESVAYGASLSLNGKQERAAVFLDEMPWEELLPQETKVIQSLLLGDESNSESSEKPTFVERILASQQKQEETFTLRTLQEDGETEAKGDFVMREFQNPDFSSQEIEPYTLPGILEEQETAEGSWQATEIASTQTSNLVWISLLSATAVLIVLYFTLPIATALLGGKDAAGPMIYPEIIHRYLFESGRELAKRPFAPDEMALLLYHRKIFYGLPRLPKSHLERERVVQQSIDEIGEKASFQLIQENQKLNS